MRLIRYQDPAGAVRYGVRQGQEVFRLIGNPLARFEVSDEPAHIHKQLAPMMPRQIIGIGLNYRRHAAEAGATPPDYPVVFMKSLNTLQHPGDPILLPRQLASHQVDYECELAVVIGKDCKNVSREDARNYILGYTCANDVSARDWQLSYGGGQWTRGKCFDTFCPLGPEIVSLDEFDKPDELRIQTLLNGETVQDWTTADMIFDVPSLIAFLSGSTTLSAGTVILTGTPHGVGMGRIPPRWLRPGDTVSVVIEGIGTLSNPVMLEP